MRIIKNKKKNKILLTQLYEINKNRTKSDWVVKTWKYIFLNVVTVFHCAYTIFVLSGNYNNLGVFFHSKYNLQQKV